MKNDEVIHINDNTITLTIPPITDYCDIESDSTNYVETENDLDEIAADEILLSISPKENHDIKYLAIFQNNREEFYDIESYSNEELKIFKQYKKRKTYPGMPKLTGGSQEIY